MRRIVILPAARRDLIEIGDFIALDNPERALSFGRKFQRLCWPVRTTGTTAAMTDW